MSSVNFSRSGRVVGHRGAEHGSILKSSRGESNMMQTGWKRLLAGWPWFQGEGAYPLSTYPEFMPPVRLLRKPYGSWDPILPDESDTWGWPVTEYEEALTIRPGLHDIARRLGDTLAQLATSKCSAEVIAALRFT